MRIFFNFFLQNITTFLIFVFIGNAAASNVNGKWFHLSKPLNHTDGRSTSIAINKYGIVYVAFDDPNYLGRASVISYHPNQEWQYVGSPGFSSEIRDYPYDDGVPVIALDSKQTPYVIFSDYGFEFSVMKYDKKGWQYVGKPRFASGLLSSRTTHIAFDSTDTPYIVFGATDGITIMKYSNGNWTSVGSKIPGSYASIAIDNHDIPYVAYVDNRENHAAVLKYIPNNGWVSVGTDAGREIIYNNANIDIAVDKHQIPYIAYEAYANLHTSEKKGVVKKYVANKWETVGSLPFETYGIRLVVDSNNMPYISYQDGGRESKASVMTFTEKEGWIFVGARKFSNGMMAHGLSLAIDSNNIPYVAYSMLHYPFYGTTVMKFEPEELYINK